MGDGQIVGSQKDKNQEKLIMELDDYPAQKGNSEQISELACFLMEPHKENNKRQKGKLEIRVPEKLGVIDVKRKQGVDGRYKYGRLFIDKVFSPHKERDYHE